MIVNRYTRELDVFDVYILTLACEIIFSVASHKLGVLAYAFYTVTLNNQLLKDVSLVITEHLTRLFFVEIPQKFNFEANLNRENVANTRHHQISYIIFSSR